MWQIFDCVGGHNIYTNKSLVNVMSYVHEFYVSKELENHCLTAIGNIYILHTTDH